MVDKSKNPPLSQPHFLHPILPGFADNLSIPVAFYNEYLNLSKVERKRKIELRTSQKRVWKVWMIGRRLENGWREFCDAHELKVCYFLVFKYLGNLGFEVTVFDENECEIEYQQLNDNEDVDPVENNDSNKSKANVAKARMQKSLAEEQHWRRNCFQMDIVDKFQIESYVGTMRPSYLQSLHFPSYFSAANNMNEFCSEIIVKDETGKVWPVKLGCSKRDKNIYTKRGWKDFVAENGLMKGDKFEFRIVSKGNTPVLSFQKLCIENRDGVLASLKRQKVTVIPKSENVNVEENNGNEKDIVKEPVSRHCGYKPGSSDVKPVTYFIKTSNPYSLKRSRLCVCRKFARANDLENKCGKIHLQNTEGETWVAELKHVNEENSPFYVTTGWREFALANGLEAGRVFMLKIVEAETELLTLKLINRRLTPEDLVNRQETKMDP